MIPWPIAFLTLFYGVVAALSAVIAWKILIGASHQPIIWSLGWLVLSAGAMGGLFLLKPWGRRLAIWTSALLMVVTLVVAGALVLSERAGAGLVITLSSVFHLLVIRYLQRPTVKAYFTLSPSRLH